MNSSSSTSPFVEQATSSGVPARGTSHLRTQHGPSNVKYDGPVQRDGRANRSDSVRSVAWRRCYNRSFAESLRWRQQNLNTLRDVIRASRVETLTERLRDLELKRTDGGNPDHDSGEGPEGHTQQDHMAPVQWDAKDVMTKVLEARDMRDGRSLLEYAAVMGKGGHVRELARWLRWKLGVGGLVKQLREPGVDGAPLLFHAATNIGCLGDVTKVIVDTIGLGGLMHQVQGTDQNGHTFLMYAARYADPEAFTRSLDLVRDLLDKEGSTGCDRQLIKATLGMGGLALNEDQTQRTESLLMYAARYATVGVFAKCFHLAETLLKNNDVAKYCKAKDSEDRTLLHYAAEARDDSMLPEVMSKLRGLDLWDSLKQGEDRQGRTPAMCLLGRRRRSSDVNAGEPGGSKVGEPGDSKTGAPGDNRIDELGDSTEDTSEESKASVNAPGASATQENGIAQKPSMENNLTTLLGDTASILTHTTKELSGIMHAARGGREAFDHACQLIANADGATYTAPHIFEMLGLRPPVGGQENTFEDRFVSWTTEEETDEYKGRCAHLIAQAALGGDEQVLQAVVAAIRKTPCDPNAIKDVLNMWAKKTDYPMTSSDLFHATRQGRLQGVDHGSKQSESRDMGDSVYPGNNCVLKASLISLTVLSENKSAVNWAAKFISRNTAPGEAMKVLRGNGGVSPLAYATWTSCSPELFKAVCNALKKCQADPGESSLKDDILPKTSHGLTPLAGALFRGDVPLVEAVLHECRQSPLTQEEIITVLDRDEDDKDDAFCETQRILWPSELCITKDVLALLKRALRNERAVPSTACALMSMRTIDFNEEIEQAHPDASVARAKKASEEGTYDGLMALIEKGWDCLDYLPNVISRIGHHEAGVISTVLCTVENARTTPLRGVSNPFVVAAIASSCMSDARKKRPEDSHGLGKLQKEIDTFTIELLSKLPSTVRGVGLELMGSFRNHTSNRQDMANLVGYIAVRWMLEPSLAGGSIDCGRLGGRQPDPLQQALNRGPKAYDFVNTPLVLNYMQLKWSCTIPRWTRRYPLDYNINEGFSTYVATIHGKQRKQTWTDGLLRFIQGWPPASKKASLTDGDPPSARKDPTLMCGFPRTTVLPSLQFSMAGILGKPHEFFLVPSIRFFYEAISYLSMLGLYCSFVSTVEVDVIPSNEIAFYVFALGLVWREILEFRDVLPPGVTAFDGERPPDTPHNRLTTGVHRYFSQDNWNILDTAAVSCIIVAFIFRFLALRLHDDPDMITSTDSDAFFEEVFFVARFFLAMIAPLLFARVLSLAQVEKYLGPMTQIIWAMLFHLARFSLFMLVVMVSFALAFFSLYNTCDGDLFLAFGTMGKSMISMFTAMIGEPHFSLFYEDPDACPGPVWKYDAGITLLAVYVVTMSILMLNLLIAVLSTVHDTVHGRSELEFQLARNQFIQRGAGVVQNGRLPPPLNLVIEVFLIGVDLLGTFCDICRLACITWNKIHPRKPQVLAEPLVDNSTRQMLQAKNEEPSEGTGQPRTTRFAPLSEASTVIALQGGLERLIFAFTMGLIALGGTAVLWVVSLPSVALRIVRWKVAPKGNHLRLSFTFLRAGHARPILLAVLRAIGFVIGLCAAVFLCLFCVLGSVILWFRGLGAVVGWWWGKTFSKKMPDGDLVKGNVMAGTSGVDGGSWKAAMDIVETSNCSWNAPKGEATGKTVMKHFDVELLLNLTTGWRLSHISSLVRRKKEERKKDKKMLKEIDDKQRGVGVLLTTTAKAKDGREEAIKAPRRNSYGPDLSSFPKDRSPMCDRMADLPETS